MLDDIFGDRSRVGDRVLQVRVPDVAGEAPHRDRGVALLSHQAELAESLDEDLERLLGQSMSKDPGNRPATALSFARALQEIEQEQRFPRTAIVVLDEQGQTTLADQTPAPEGDEDDRTRVRSPQAVRSAQAPPQPRPSQPAYPSMSGSTSIPAAAHTNVASPRPGTVSHGVPDDVAEEGTIRVDRSRAAGSDAAEIEGERTEGRPDTGEAVNFGRGAVRETNALAGDA